MSNGRISLLRLDYLFAVIVPTLLAIYFNDLNLEDYIKILISFGFFGISGNILNDIFDRNDIQDLEAQNRTTGYHTKELVAITLFSATLGFSLLFEYLWKDWTILLYALSALLLVSIYCWKKQIPILNQFLLAFSHIIIPYLIIKKVADITNPFLTLGEILFLIALLFFAVSGQTVHEIIDGDAISQFSLKTQQMVVVVSAMFSIIFGILALVVTKNYILIGLILLPLGIIYSFRHPKKSRKSIKDTGILMGNMVMVFFIVLILY